MEIPSPDSNHDLARYLDEATLFMSGSHMWQNLPQYQALLAQGETALPFLLQELMHEAERGTEAPPAAPRSSWWRMEMIWVIAHRAERPIDYDDATLGKYDAIKAQTIAWGVINGYAGQH